MDTAVIKADDLHSNTIGHSEIALIHAAEKLFAERGIAGVSLRQINQEAGSRNLSAAHYHFGSREGLVTAILQYREAPIERRRQELLARSLVDGRTADLRFYLDAYIGPLAEALSPRPEGNHYLRFLAHFRHFAQDHLMMRRMLPAAYRMGEGLSDMLDYLPAKVASQRIAHLRGMVIVSLADAEAEISSGSRRADSVPFLAENLTDMLAAALTAPVSGLSRQLLKDAAEAEGEASPSPRA